MATANLPPEFILVVGLNRTFLLVRFEFPRRMGLHLVGVPGLEFGRSCGLFSRGSFHVHSFFGIFLGVTSPFFPGILFLAGVNYFRQAVFRSESHGQEAARVLGEPSSQGRSTFLWDLSGGSFHFHSLDKNLVVHLFHSKPLFFL